jgi:hypothetical protein
MSEVVSEKPNNSTSSISSSISSIKDYFTDNTMICFILLLIILIIVYIVRLDGKINGNTNNTNPGFTSKVLSTVMNLDENLVSNIILFFILLLCIFIIIRVINLSRISTKQCDYMNDLYSTLNGNIRSISKNDTNYNGNLNEYYIKTAYNACSGGDYKNDVVNICNLKAVLKEGVRCLDFEIYSIDNKPVVATSTTNNYYIKETYNSVNFSDVMNTIKNYAFSGSTAPNKTDPVIIHLRFMSNNQNMYTNLAAIFKSYESILLGKDYSYETFGHNLGSQPLLNFMNKVILIFDKSNNAFSENKNLMEYVNLTSNSIFMRAYSYHDIKNNHDLEELKEFNKKNMSIVFPDGGTNPENPNGTVTREAGCQMVAMRYQNKDDNLANDIKFFNNCMYAFCLKPEELRNKSNNTKK